MGLIKYAIWAFTIGLVLCIGTFVTYLMSTAAIGVGIDGNKCIGEARTQYCSNYGLSLGSKIVMTGGLFSTEKQLYFCVGNNSELQIDYNAELFYHCTLASQYIKFQGD